MQQKLIILLVLLVAVVLSSTTPLTSVKIADQAKIHLCSQLHLSNCSQSESISKTGFKFCALQEDGTWRNASSACEACRSGETVGIADLACNGDKPVATQISPLELSVAGPLTIQIQQVKAAKAETPAESLKVDSIPVEPVPAIKSQTVVQTPVDPVPTKTDLKAKPTTRIVDGAKVTLCTDPSFDNCPDFFIAIYDPKFCALKKDGTWRSATFACQACQSADIIGVANGACVDNKPVPTEPTTPPGPAFDNCQSDSDCKSFQLCNEGECIDKCAVIKCSGPCFHGKCKRTKKCGSDKQCNKGKTCVNGYCSGNPADQSFDFCPTTQSPQVVECDNPRPNLKDCPVLYYIRAPDPLFCGVKADGTRVNFPRSCEACMDASIQYYFDVPCHAVPFICEASQQCSGDYCLGTLCANDEDCPYDWQVCSSGTCADPCIYMRCAGCKYGQCNYEQPVQQCTYDGDCSRQRQTCVGLKCVDECLTTPCEANHSCKRGKCSPL